jgi:hypothetical protein
VQVQERRVQPHDRQLAVDLAHGLDLGAILRSERPAPRLRHVRHHAEERALHLCRRDRVAVRELDGVQAARMFDQRAQQKAPALDAIVLAQAELVPALVEGARLLRITAVERHLTVDALAHERIVQRPGGAEQVHHIAARLHVDHELHRRLTDLRAAGRERSKVCGRVQMPQALAGLAPGERTAARRSGRGLRAEAELRAISRLARQRRPLGPAHEVDAIGDALVGAAEQRHHALELGIAAERARVALAHRHRHARAGCQRLDRQRELDASHRSWPVATRRLRRHV